MLLTGAGKIGGTIAAMLHESGGWDLKVVDTHDDALNDIAALGIPCEAVDITKLEERSRVIDGVTAVISTLPYDLNGPLAESSKASGAHYFDLTEDVDSMRHVKSLAPDARSAIMPQCGLAPGFISIVAHDLARQFDAVHSIQMRVGALPEFPANALMYNLTWSTVGLINEYCNPCEVIADGRRMEVRALDGYETFSLDGITYEAFNTSGGLGTLCETFDGKITHLEYKTVCYPGHRDLVRLLARESRLCERRDVFKDVLEHAVPMTTQDVVLIFISVSGEQGGRLMQESFARKIYPADIGGIRRSAIQVTTAAGMCAVVDLVCSGDLPQQGFVRQEDVDLNEFLSNRYGRWYESEVLTVGEFSTPVT